MEKEEKYIEIDLMKIFKVLWKKAWLIALVTIVFMVLAFVVTAFAITPQYKSSISMYVNNTVDQKEGMPAISTTDLDAAKSLVDTYIVILEAESTIREIRDDSGLDYSVKELQNMITALSVNATEVFTIEVVGPDTNDNKIIADTIGVVLPEKISAIVDGSSVRIVDPTVQYEDPVSPNKMKNTLLAGILGFILICAIVIIRSMRDTRIHDSDDLAHNYDIPVLAVIPDLSVHDDHVGYYGKKSKRK